MIIESIKEGFALTNKNLQVTVIRVVAAIISFITLIFSLAIPVIAAIFYLGLDISSAQDLWPFLQDNPFAFVSRYLGVIMFLVFSLMIYMVFISMLFIYVLGGSVGVLRNAAVNLSYKFSLSSFLGEAGQNFGRLCRMLSLAGLYLIVLLAASLFFSAVVTIVINFISGSTTFIGMYFKSFFLVAVIVLGSITFIAAFVFSVFAVVICVIERQGAADALKKTFDFLKDNPMSFVYCLLLFFGAAVLSVLLFTFKLPFSMVPFLGPPMGIVLSFMSVLIQSYISVAVWASLVAYYLKTTKYPVYTSEYEI
jgi:hypothetical protein